MSKFPGRWFISRWVFVGAAIFALSLAFFTLLLLLWTRPDRRQAIPATAMMIVIRAPTATFTPAPRTPTPTPTPTSLLPPGPPPGAVSVGTYVQIAGTGGDGLRLRVEPSLSAQVRLVGAEAEVFRVKDGPRQADGFTWWLLEGLADPERLGWAVANYLAVVQNP